MDQRIANADSNTATTMPIQMELEQAEYAARPADHNGQPPASDKPAQLDAHMTIVQTFVNLLATPTPPRRDPAAQQPRRLLEQTVRQRAIEVANRLTDLGCGHAEAAERLGLNQRTLRHWRESLCEPCPAALPMLGRPLVTAAPTQRQHVLAWLDDVGPGVGVPTLRRQFDSMARAELDDLLKDYRHHWRAANLRALHVLTWQKPGTVWAADFATAPCLIDGRFRYLLAVRDLASGLQLLWQPVEALTADVLIRELTWLFTLHATPWILKTDNGSAFIADTTRWFLLRANVHPLFSPPLCPSYNGSIEASIGAMKRRTQQQSDHAGQPGLWTSDHLDAARELANTATHPRRLLGLTPQHVWDARPALTTEQRDLFETTLAQCQTQARLERGLHPQQPLTRAEQAAVDRLAFHRALVAHDILLFRRRSILPRITRPKLAIQG